MVDVEDGFKEYVKCPYCSWMAPQLLKIKNHFVNHHLRIERGDKVLLPKKECKYIDGALNENFAYADSVTDRIRVGENRRVEFVQRMKPDLRQQLQQRADYGRAAYVEQRPRYNLRPETEFLPSEDEVELHPRMEDMDFSVPVAPVNDNMCVEENWSVRPKQSVGIQESAKALKEDYKSPELKEIITVMSLDKFILSLNDVLEDAPSKMLDSVRSVINNKFRDEAEANTNALNAVKKAKEDAFMEKISLPKGREEEAMKAAAATVKTIEANKKVSKEVSKKADTPEVTPAGNPEQPHKEASVLAKASKAIQDIESFLAECGEAPIDVSGSSSEESDEWQEVQRLAKRTPKSQVVVPEGSGLHKKQGVRSKKSKKSRKTSF